MMGPPGKHGSKIVSGETGENDDDDDDELFHRRMSPTLAERVGNVGKVGSLGNDFRSASA